MTDKDLKQTLELLKQQQQQVTQSPEAARKFLEDLGVLWMVMPDENGNLHPPSNDC